MDDLMGLNAPEPLREYYSRSFYRTAWVFTALDAGFWTAMSIKPKPLRDLMSLVFSLYYLVFTNRAIEKVRKVRALVTIDHLRVSWNKAEDNPVLRFARWMHSKKLHVDRVVYLPHPSADMEQAPCHIMFVKPAQREYRRCRRVVLNFPGGGFVSMGPRSHKDYLSSWAQRTGAIVVSVDYAKAPEYPFPYAINQCFAIYRELVQTNGRCIGLDSSIEPLQIILAGDSAGGNISSAVTLRIIESEESLRLPDGLVLIYGHFNTDVRAWMSEDEAEILLGGSKTTDNRKGKEEPLAALVSPRDHLHHESPLATTNLDDGYQRRRTKKRPYLDDRVRVVQGEKVGYAPLAMTSSFTYFNDMILSPEMMRAIVIMYVGPHARPDFRTNYYLSPAVAPDHLLAKFPPVYFMCGEKDPLVDDTLLFAARIRKAKQKLCKQQGPATTEAAPTSKLYGRRHSQPRAANSSTQFYIGSTDASDNDDDGGDSSLGHGQHLLPASLRMSMFAKNTQQQPQQQHRQQPIIKIKLVKGMSHGFMQMYPLLPEAKRVADTIGDWILELMDGDDRITEFSRCASMVVVEEEDTNKLERTASVVLLTEDEEDSSDTNSNDTVTSNGSGGTPSIDRHGIEVVTAADMVRKRGRDLTNPLD